MKKFYLTGMALAIGFLGTAQNQPSVKPIKPMKKGVKLESKVRTNEVTAARGGGAIWSDDFSDPSTWVIEHDATACSLDWEIGVNLGCGGSYAIDTIQSNTKFNGYAMVDSDEYGGENGGNEVEDSWFTNATPIDLSGFPNVVVEFESFYRKYQTEECYLVVSTNNTDWPDLTPDTTGVSANPNVFQVWPEITGNQDNVDNPSLRRINISEVAGDSSQVWIRFHWTGTWGYAWFVDDVRVIEQPNDDLVMDAAYVSHNGTGDEYGRVPTNQTTQNMLIGSSVTNFGVNDQANVTWAADFTGPTAINVSNTLPLANSGTSFAMEDDSFAGPLAVGNYSGDYMVYSSADSVGGNEFGNNIGSREFAVTENTGRYSLDGLGVYSDPTIGGLQTSFFDGGDDGFFMFTYYAIEAELEVHGIEILLTSGTRPGGLIAMALHDTAAILVDDDPFTTITNTADYEITVSDSVNGIVTLPFEDGPELLSQTAVYASCAMYSNAGEFPVGILDDRTVPQPGNSSLIYIDNEQIFGNGNAAAIRLLLSPNIGVQDYGDLNNMIISPNPSTGLFRVAMDLEHSSAVNFEVYGMDGARVAVSTIDRVSGPYNHVLDLSDLSNGMYLVSVKTDAGLRTQRVVISK